MAQGREIVSVDDRGRSYLTKLGFVKGMMLVADPVAGEELAWIIRPGRVVTDVELAILSDPDNVASLQRAASELLAGDNTLELM